VSLADLIADFVERQYVAEEGGVRENVERLFSEDLAYHTPAGTLGREDLVAMGSAVRATSREGRSFALSAWEEHGSTVSWRLSARLPGMGAGGGDAMQESAVTAVFGADGLVREVWSRDASHP
jgi:hypothetical protein